MDTVWSTKKRSEGALIAAVFYLFVSIAIGAWTFMRGFEFTACGRECNLTVMSIARDSFLLVDSALLLPVLIVFAILWVKKVRILWLPLAALIFISTYAVVANVAFSIAQNSV